MARSPSALAALVVSVASGLALEAAIGESASARERRAIATLKEIAACGSAAFERAGYRFRASAAADPSSLVATAEPLDPSWRRFAINGRGVVFWFDDAALAR